jgi:hypothetical protein
MNPSRQLLLVCALAMSMLGALAGVAHAEFGVTEGNFEAGTCNVRGCEYSSPTSAFYTQAAGHPEWGITGFELNSSSGVPEGKLKRIRVDVPPGLAADPQAPMPTCSKTQFESDAKLCPSSSLVGEVEMKALVELVPGVPIALPALTGQVYNLPLESGRPLLFGITVEPLAPLVAPVKLMLVGHLSDAVEPGLAARGVPSGDYHEYFEIDSVPTEGEVIGGIKAPLRVLKSKLLFDGHAGGNFLTLPSVCSPSTTSYLEVESYEGQVSSTATHTPVGVEGCDKVPFKPTATATPEIATSDQPDGVTVDVHVPQNTGAQEINTADIRDAHVTLPEGLTLDPSAAHGLETCSESQIAIGTANPPTCPAGSRVGSVTIETDLPAGSLTGGVYLGNPAGGPITGPPYTIYLDTESSLGVSVKLKGLVGANPETGRLEATFTENPQLPFSDLILKLNGGSRAPLANPLVCTNAPTESVFTPYTGGAAALASTPFTATGCPSPLPFSLSQGTVDSSSVAGAHTSFTLNLTRADGQQYLSAVKTVLPPGLLGAVPSVTLCGEAQANAGGCLQASRIGSVSITAGSGSEPFPFSGSVYLTGPYDGAPYGLSIVVPAVAGPFNLGAVIARAQINVDSTTARLIISTPPAGAPGALPSVIRGVPVRLKSVSVTVDREKFLFNPTNCGALSTETALASTMGATDSLSSPLAVSGCSSLPFKPAFTVSTSSKTSKATGAELTVKVSQAPGQANIHEVHVELPKSLVPRTATLQKACPDTVFNTGFAGCPAASKVGQASVSTPVLADKLTGPAYLVSHGGAAFPDLELILSGDGVSVILDGKTNINGAITSNTFSAIPDVPINSFELSLPAGSNSVLSAEGNLCSGRLVMPTTIVAQSGAKINQNTTIAVSGCAASKKTAKVKIVSRRVKGHLLILGVRTPAAGRVSVSGQDLKRLTKSVSKATTITLNVPLSKKGVVVLKRMGKLQIHVRVGFVPKSKHPTSRAFAAVKFKR